jgi:predicted NAD/FAD-binding protein
MPSHRITPADPPSPHATGRGPQSVAVVGTGVSGLVAARLIDQSHRVTVFEAAGRVGGHTHTVDVEVDGEHHAVDTGFIVYNEATYPLFTRLLALLGVATRESDMSFSVTCERSGLEYGTRSLAALFAQRRNLLRPSFHRMLRDILRFHREAVGMLDDDRDLTLGDVVEARRYSREFVDQFLVPMGAAIWSASPERFLEFPARTFVRFFWNHGLLDLRSDVRWRVVRGGSSRYVDALIEPFCPRIRTSTPVKGVRRLRRGIEIRTGDGGRERFDHVVLACHSDQALRLLDDPSEAERNVLGAIAYQPNEVVLHGDARLMPSRAAAWASWNYRIPARTQDGVAVTYDMRRLQGIRCREPLLVTLNGGANIDPQRVHARLVYHHPVFTLDAIRAQARRASIDGVAHTHYCGAYWGHGFHEDGVASALAVARRFGEGLETWRPAFTKAA